MSSGPRFNLPYATVVDATGVPIVGALLNFYLTASSTRADTYSNASLTVANTNPVVSLDDGWFPAIFLDPAINYKVVLTEPDGTEIWTADPVSGWFGIAANYAALRGLTASGNGVVYVLGRTTTMDGGQGWFSADPSDTTSLDNGGTIIVAGTLRWKRLYNGAVFPEWWGAKGNGTAGSPTDDSAAIAAAVATGIPVQGTPGAVYGMATPLDISAVPDVDISNLAFIDLNPGGTTRKFIYGLGNTSVRMRRVSVDRNGTGGGGTLGTASAFWIENAAFIDLCELEVTGDDAGSGIRLVSCMSGALDRAYCHDMTAGTPSSANPGDGADQLIGIWEVGCIGLTITSAVVKNLLTQCVDYAPKNINTRGITTGGAGSATTANMVSLDSCFVANVDEGFDYTGDQYPVGMQTTNCRAEYCRKFGFKSAGTVLHSNYVNCYAYRCTLDGFYIQGGSTTIQTNDVRLIGCKADSTGYNVATYYSSGTTTTGFRCDRGSADVLHPTNVWFESCDAFGGTEMKFGFVNSVAETGPPYLAQDRNRIINCTAKDYTEAAATGFIDGYSLLGRETNQTIPDDTSTAIVWNRAHDGRDGFYFSGTNGMEAIPPTTDLVFGWATRVQITCYVPFENLPSGFCALTGHIITGMLDETISGGRDIRAAIPGTETTPAWTVVRDVLEGDILRIYAYQVTGAPQDINGGDSVLYVVDLKSPLQIIETP